MGSTAREHIAQPIAHTIYENLRFVKGSATILHFVLYEICLRVTFKLSLAGRTAKIEVSTVISAAMPCRCYFYYHTTNRVPGGFGSACSMGVTLKSRTSAKRLSETMTGESPKVQHAS